MTIRQQIESIIANRQKYHAGNQSDRWGVLFFGKKTWGE